MSQTLAACLSVRTPSHVAPTRLKNIQLCALPSPQVHLCASNPVSFSHRLL